MDPLNLESLPGIAAPLIDRVQRALDAELQQASGILTSEIDRAVLQIGNVVRGALEAVQAVEGKTAADLRALIESLDGWTATIRLTKPKPKGE